MRTPASNPIDDRLRELLAVEQRLQARVADARTTAERRIRAAREDSTRQLNEADTAIAAAVAADSRADQAAFEAAMTDAATAHEATLAALARLTEDDVDRLARQVLERLRAELGGRQ